MTEKIRNTTDNRNYGRSVFIDLNKAFDIVNYFILIKKLDHYGISGVSLQWFQSYLSDSKQYLSLNGQTSGNLLISQGVPQGLILGHF